MDSQLPCLLDFSENNMVVQKYSAAVLDSRILVPQNAITQTQQGEV